jgi:peroxiredoxin
MHDNNIKMKIYLWLSFLLFSSVGAMATTNPDFKSESSSDAASKSVNYQIGDAVANFRLKNIDGNMISLTDYAGGKGLIVIFTSNHCPFAKAYEDRILALNNKYASQGFPVIAINPSDPATHQDDSFEKMKERASGKGYTYPYLVDETQATSKAFGAARTPQVFVLVKNGAKFIVQYIGMIDDNPQDPAGATKFYVDEAVTNLLGGKPVVTTMTKPIGCVIKWKN